MSTPLPGEDAHRCNRLFDPDDLAKREIRFDDHSLGCMAGASPERGRTVDRPVAASAGRTTMGR